MSIEAMLDIGGVLGHINNQNGSAVLNQSTADNFMTASKILSTSMDSTKIFNENSFWLLLKLSDQCFKIK